MPELPEVETIRRQLESKIKGKTILEVKVKDARLVKKISLQEFKRKILHNKVSRISRQGKLLIVELAKGNFLLIHLRISGWVTVTGLEDKEAKISFRLDSKEYFNICDRRVLGQVMLVSDYRQIPLVKNMGQDALAMAEKRFIEILQAKKTKIKPLLMDQKLIAGIGNIYSQEALFCARILPQRPANSLSQQEAKVLFCCLQEILREAIKEKGTSADTYRQIDGGKGKYEQKLKVYGRASQSCYVCGELIKKVTLGGRGTYFCPKCQK